MTVTSPPKKDPRVEEPSGSVEHLWLRPWCVFIAFLLIGFGVYAPALSGELVWDDHYLIADNPFFRSPVFAAEVFRHYLFSESFSTYYRPVQNLSYMLDYWLWGNAPLGYHCTNVVLHALAASMLFVLLGQLMPGLWKNEARARVAALLIALAWLVHPVHNAAVAYISGRADSLAAVFALGAWLSWRRSCLCRGAIAVGSCAFLSALLLLLALCSKEIALVWVVLFLVHTLFFETALSLRAKVGSLAGLVGVVAIYAVLHSLPEARAAAQGNVPEPFVSRVILMFRALGDYCGLMFAPVRLMMERSLGPASMFGSRQAWWHGVAGEYLSIVGLLTFAVAAWLFSRPGDAKSLRGFGVVWFAVAFLPISNLIPLNAEVAEHWIYLASIGFLMLIAGAIAMLPVRAMRWAVVIALLMVGAFAVRTGFRAAEWADAERFARATIASGGTSPRMLAYFAQELGRKGRLNEQEQVFRKTLALYPDFVTARINLGLCLQKQGRNEEARALLDLGRVTSSVQNVPRTWNAALNLAGQHHKEGRSAEALALIREWRPQFPETWELVAYEATILRDTGRIREAVAVAEPYARNHWWHLPSQLGTAALQRDAGDYEAALALARRAQRLDIRGAAAFAETARNELALGRLMEALESQAEAVARAPRNAGYLDLFAGILHALGREQEALATRRRAATLAAEDARALL